MTLAPAQQAELLDLIDAVCEAGPTAPATERLEALLLADDDACRYYLDYAYLHGALLLAGQPYANKQPPEAIVECRMAIPAPGLGDAVPDSPSIPNVVITAPPSPDISTPRSPYFIDTSLPSPFPPPRYSFIDSPLFAFLLAGVIVGVGLAIAAMWKMPDYSQMASSQSGSSSLRGDDQETDIDEQPSSSDKTAPSSSSLPPMIGQITGMVDCKWSDPQTDAFNGASVPLGRKYALSAGLMQITYDSGAKVILHGPCTYEVESETGGYLSLGKLTAKLEKRSEVRGQRSGASNQKSEIRNPNSPLSTLHAPLFTVKTPTATVTDLGTEFGVDVAESGCTFALVYDGIVEMQSIGRHGQRGPVVRLIENESARTEKDDHNEGVVVRSSGTEPVTFVRAEQLPKVAEELRLKSFHRWQMYSEELRKDPSLLAYYDFQRRKDSPTALANVAANNDRSLDGVIMNNTAWGNGRAAGRHALRFHNRADIVQINLPQKFDDLTLTTWVCLESMKNTEPSSQDGAEPEVDYSGLLMSDGWGTHPGQLHWLVRSDGRVGFVVSGGCHAYQATPSVDNTQLHCWRHLAVVYDRNAARVRLYVDGQVTDDVPLDAHVPIQIGPAAIGHWNGWGKDRNLLGRIDELAIFDRVFESTEIQKMYEAGRPENVGQAGVHTDKQ